jgi:hypothetical protein
VHNHCSRAFNQAVIVHALSHGSRSHLRSRKSNEFRLQRYEIQLRFPRLLEWV